MGRTLRDPVEQGLTARDAADVFHNDVRDAAESLDRRSADVRERHDVFAEIERVARIPRLGPVRVEAEPAERAGDERSLDGGAIDDRSARAVDEERARLEVQKRF